MVIYALLGTSRPLSVSTTTTIAILTAANLGKAVPNGVPGELAAAGATLAVLVGTMLLLASLLRLGFVANFISDPVLAGFKAGIGVVIVVDQVPKLLGFHIAKAGFFRDIWAMIQHPPHVSLTTVAVGVAMIVVLIGVERFVPRAPAPLIAVALGIAASAAFRITPPGCGNGGQRSARSSRLGLAESRARYPDVARRDRDCPDELC
jgi:MFS superfamily sulfate permease-like transporter